MAEATVLPAAVSAAIESLLLDNELTSWKLAFDGKSTVAVLRFTPTIETTNGERTTTSYRKKTASQIRRDQQRSERRHKERENSKCDQKCSVDISSVCDAEKSGVACNSDVPMSVLIDSVSELGRISDSTCDTTCPQKGARSKPSESDGVLGSTGVPVPSCSFTTSVCNEDSKRVVVLSNDSKEGGVSDDESWETRDSDVDAISGDRGACCDVDTAATSAGFEPEQIRARVSGVTADCKINLRNRARNQTLTKFVLNNHQGKEQLYCESSDVLLIFDCQSHTVTHWYVKDAVRRGWMLAPVLSEALDCLRRRKAIGADLYVDHRERLAGDLDAFMAVIREHLG